MESILALSSVSWCHSSSGLCTREIKFVGHDGRFISLFVQITCLEYIKERIVHSHSIWYYDVVLFTLDNTGAKLIMTYYTSILSDVPQSRIYHGIVTMPWNRIQYVLRELRWRFCGNGGGKHLGEKNSETHKNVNRKYQCDHFSQKQGNFWMFTHVKYSCQSTTHMLDLQYIHASILHVYDVYHRWDNFQLEADKLQKHWLGWGHLVNYSATLHDILRVSLWPRLSKASLRDLLETV